MGSQLPVPKSWRSPPSQFLAHVCCGQSAALIKVALGVEVGLGSGYTVLDGDPAPRPKKGAEPLIFGQPLLCQTAGWIKMPLGAEEGLGPNDIVSNGDAAPPRKDTAPNFRPMSIVPNGWMDQDVTWHGCRPRHKRHVLDGDQSSPPKKGGGQTPNFRPCLL